MGLFGPEKYIYLSVCFQDGRKTYYYRTKDKSIKVNDVVMVPVPNEPDKPAIVTGVHIFTENEAPYPPEKTKMITGMADRNNHKLFDGVDMRMPIDIAKMRIRTENGIEEIITTESERKELRKKCGNNPNLKIIESCKPAKADNVINPQTVGGRLRRIICTLALIVIEIALIMIFVEGCYGAWFILGPIIFGLLIMGAWEGDFAHKMLFVCLFVPFILPFWWLFRKPEKKKKDKEEHTEHWIFW